MQNRSRSLLRGATVDGLALLLAYEELRNHMYVYGDTTRSVDYVDAEKSRWRMLWLLAWYHRRHVLCWRGLLEIVPQTMQVRSFVNTPMWEACLNTGVKDFEEKDEERRILRRVLHRSMPICGQRLPPDIEAWLASLQSAAAWPAEARGARSDNFCRSLHVCLAVGANTYP